MDRVLEEIQINSEMMKEASPMAGGGPITTIIAYHAVSWYLGNKGYVCTWTVECMNSCN